MESLWIGIAVNVLLGVLAEKQIPRKYRAAVRKLYMALHANRFLFLTDEDLAQLAQPRTEDA